LALLSETPLNHPDLAAVMSLSRAHLLPSTAARHGYVTIGDLLSLTENLMFEWDNVGVTKVGRFLDALSRLEHMAPQFAEKSARSLDDRLSGAHIPSELARIAEWAIFDCGAKTWGDVFTAFVVSRLPRDVDIAWQSIAQRPLSLNPAPQPLEVLKDWIDHLPERERGVLEGRIVRLTERTLQDIADDYDVTRERIRQIQVRLEKDLNGLLSNEDWRAVGWAVQSLQKGLGALAPLDEVTDLSPDAPMAREFRVLLWFAGYDWDWNGRSLHRRGFAQPRVSDLLTEEDGLRIDKGHAVGILEERGVLGRHMDFAIDRIKGVRRIDDALVLWPNNIADRGAAILAVNGHPMTVEELADAVPGDFNRRGFRDRVFNHPLVMRTGKNEVGLRSWGLEEYSGIVNAMMRLLEEEGPTTLTEMQARLAGRFNISPASVSMYAAAPVFLLERGHIRLREEIHTYQPRNQPWNVPGLYLSSRGLVIWHVEVDHDLLRGSGRSIPNELGLACGLTLNSSVDFTGPAGPIRMRWPDTSHVGATIGSLRAVADALSAEEGSRLRLVFDIRRHALTAEMLPRSGLGGIEPSLEVLTGLPPEDCESLERLSDVLGTSPADVLRHLRHRGDQDVADCARHLPVSNV
jgi:hypothetical protein